MFKYLELLVLSCLAVFAPVKAVLLTALVLVFFDALTGVIASYRRGEPITSAGLKRTVGKIALYESALCMAFLAQQYLIGPDFPVFKLVSAMIGLTECKSALENMDSIAGTSFFKSLVDKITQKSEKS